MRHNYDSYQIEITSAGVTTTFRNPCLTKFADAKKSAVRRLTDSLELAHGRGEHTVSVRGMTWTDTTTPERRKVGFTDWDWVLSDVLFTL